MTTQEVREFLDELTEQTQNGEINWTPSGKTRFESTINGEEIILDRFNNLDTDRAECFLRIGGYENVYVSDDDEFDMITEFVDNL